MIGIYCLINTITGKMYIGSTISLVRRKRSHFKDLEKGNHYNIILQNSYDKHGIDVFQFNILEVIGNEADLIPRERFWIEYHDTINNGYNLIIASHTNDESKRKRISDSLKGKSLSKEHKNKISEGLKGRVQSQETRDKIKASNTGQKRSKQTRLNLTKARFIIAKNKKDNQIEMIQDLLWRQIKGELE